jgi:phage-related protein
VIQSIFDPIALPIKTLLDSVAFAIQPLGQMFLTEFAGPLRSRVKPIVDGIATTIQTLVDSLPASIKPLINGPPSAVKTFVDHIASPVQTIIDSISLPIKKALLGL